MSVKSTVEVEWKPADCELSLTHGRLRSDLHSTKKRYNWELVVYSVNLLENLPWWCTVCLKDWAKWNLSHPNLPGRVFSQSFTFWMFKCSKCKHHILFTICERSRYFKNEKLNTLAVIYWRNKRVCLMNGAFLNRG